MDATTAQPTLLSAARNFIRKSAGTAVIVIAPLAAVSMAPEAKGQVIFGLAQTSGAFTSMGSGSAFAGASGFFSYTDLATYNNINGVRFGMNVSTFMSAAPAVGGVTAYFDGIFGTSSGALPVGTDIPFDYAFTLTPTGGINLSGWTINIYLHDSAESSFFHIISGSGTGNISGSEMLSINSTDNPNGLPNFSGYSVTLSVDFSTGSSSDSFVIGMDPNIGQGFTFNMAAIPEPSTYAALFGLGALGFAIVRRSRRLRAA